MPPCSASGFQSVWMTTVSGQPAAARSVPPISPLGSAAAEELPPPSSSSPQAERTRARLAAAARPMEVRVLRTGLLQGWGGTASPEPGRRTGEGVSARVAGGVVPTADGELAQPAEQQEDGDAEAGGDEDRGEQLGPLEP